MPTSERPPLPRGPYLVLGLARSGEAAALVLHERGERVLGVDGGDPATRPSLAAAVRRLRAAGVEVHVDASLDRLPPDIGALVKSPGVPAQAPLVRQARAAGIPVLGEFELAWRLLPNDFIAVTGTNGKTTTTEWIGHIHRTAARSATVAGNVGTALSTLVGRSSPETTIIAEASSFQLEDAVAFAPEVGVLLNITPDHLDRHGSFEEYRAAKLRMFAHQNGADVAVLPEGFTEPIGGEARRLRFGPGAAAELRIDEDRLSWQGQPFVEVAEIGLPGPHNLENAAAAAAACLARELPIDAVADGLRTFTGVAHRLEHVAEFDGVSFINDSKATNVASTIVALGAYPAGVHLILGGQGKGQDFAPLAPLVADRCTAVYLIGEDAARIAAAIERSGVTLRAAGDLERALGLALDAAQPGEVVMLSPACASFDQFRDFEARGDAFRELVLARADATGRAS